MKGTKMNSPIPNSRALTTRFIEESFMYTETSAIFSGDVFVTFEGTDIIQVSKFTFCFIRFF